MGVDNEELLGDGLLVLCSGKQIRLLEIRRRFANCLTNLLVSQFVKVILARVNLPLLSVETDLDSSSTRKSLTRILSIPPMPLLSTV